MSDDRCMGPGAGVACEQRGVIAYSFQACSDHKAAIYYKLQNAGFDLPGRSDEKDRFVLSDPKTQEMLMPLARRMCAAMISWKLGIGIEYALKKHVADKVGLFWVDIARQAVESDLRRSVVIPVPDGKPGTEKKPSPARRRRKKT